MPADALSAGDKVSDDPAAQVDFALDRMKAVVEAAGLTSATWSSSIRI